MKILSRNNDKGAPSRNTSRYTDPRVQNLSVLSGNTANKPLGQTLQRNDNSVSQLGNKNILPQFTVDRAPIGQPNVLHYRPNMRTSSSYEQQTQTNAGNKDDDICSMICHTRADETQLRDFVTSIEGKQKSTSQCLHLNQLGKNHLFPSTLKKSYLTENKL